METNNTKPKRLTRGSFLTALVLSVTSAMVFLEGCGSGGGGDDATRRLLIARWNATGGSFLEFKDDNTYVANFGGTAESGTWTLDGDTLTLRSSAGGADSVMKITSITETALNVSFPDGSTVSHTKATTPTPTPSPTPSPSPSPTPRPTIKKVFRFTGGAQHFTVPAGVTSIHVKLWGAGGADGGGSGAFIEGDLTVTPGETLDLYIGDGGKVATSGFSAAIYGDGGRGALGNGGGGGHNVIARGTTDLAIVGAGGGGAGGGGAGGGGGGIGTFGGKGGTQFAGGAAAVGGDAKAGGQYYGGDARSLGGGGGGSGYYGGGGGGGGSATGSSPGPGGGGSSYTDKLTNKGTSTGRSGGGSATAPGGASDPDYVAGVGIGGAISQPGGAGMVVISYLG